MNEVIKLSFTGQTFYIGIDVHKKRWVVTIRNNFMELKTFSMNPSPEELGGHMEQNYPGGTYCSTYEAGFCGFWIHSRLQQLGFDNVVIHAADVPTTDKEKKNKRDKIDSRKLARELENRSLNSIYVPDLFHQQLRSLRRLRDRCATNERRVKQRIKAHLHFYGIELPSQKECSHWSGRFIQWLKSVEFPHLPAQDYLEFCLEELQQNRDRTARIVRQLRHHCQENHVFDTVKHLSSITGIGFITAITIYTEIVDMQRFRTLDHLASFVGLVPTEHSSGDRTSHQGLTFRRNRYLRHLIIESAWVAARKDPALLAAFNELTKRMAKQDAIIRIARKLLNRIRYVWKNQSMYVTAVVE